MDWLTAFRDTTLPGGNESDDLHSGTIRNTIMETGGGVYDAAVSSEGEIGSFALTKKLRATTTAVYDGLRALVGKRGFLWRGRRVSSGVPLGAAGFAPFNADGLRANLTMNDGTEPTLESGSVVGFMDGKFGNGAVSLTEGFTNLCQYPVGIAAGIGSSPSQWQSSWGDTIAVDSSKQLFGADSYSLTAAGSAGTAGYWRETVSINTDYTFSAWIWADSSVTGDVYIRVLGSDLSGLGDSSYHPKDGEWHNLSVTINSGSFTEIRPVIWPWSAVTGESINYTGTQLTQTSYQLPFRYYKMPGVTGAAGSTSVAAYSDLEYDKSVLSENAGTIAGWVNVVNTSNALQCVAGGDQGWNALICGFNAGKSELWFRYNHGYHATGFTDFIPTATITAGWHHLAWTWDGSTIAIYLDGVKYSTAQTSAMITLTNALRIGDRYTSTISLPFSGELCNFVVQKSAMTAGDIAAIYNSGVPLDEARVQRGIDARCMDLQATRRFDEPNHTDVALDFATIGRAWRGEVRQIANTTLTASGSLSLVNNGDVVCKNLVLTINVVDATSIVLSIPGFQITRLSASAGDTFVIDCAAHTITLNGADDYNNWTFSASNTTADWFALEVGANTLSIAPGSGKEVEFIAQWYDTYR